MAEINPFLRAERVKCSFDQEYLTNLIDGGDFLTEARRKAKKIVMSLQKMKEAPRFQFMNREEIYAEAMRKAEIFISLKEPSSSRLSPEEYYISSCMFPNEINPLFLQNQMVIPMIESQGDEKQVEEWLPKLRDYQVFMTYAQTELGHGTYIRGFETTATYHPSTQRFTLHSPTLTSTKWWIGGLGKTADHAIVMARLLLRGEDRGIHAFIVQLRQIETHEVMPGLTIGDIGPKFGFEGTDNGFVRFDNYNIPRRNMLMKYAQVHEDGTYTTTITKKSSKLAYGSMVFIRAMLVYAGASRLLAQAVTIATRYSCIRHQSEYEPGKPEPQIIEYQAQQQQLFSQLATAYTFCIAGLKLRELYFSVSYDIQQGNLETLPELHASSACLKALTLEEAQRGVEVCRLACGGHGYSSASNFPKLYTQVAAACTYEGIHPVLYLQTARYLVKSYKASSSSPPPSSSSSAAAESTTGYINRLSGNSRHFKLPFSSQDLLTMFEARSFMCIVKATKKLDDWLKVGQPYHVAWNLTSLDLIKAAKAHSYVFLISSFHEKKTIVETEKACVYKVLDALFQLYALTTLVSQAADFVEACGLTFDQLDSCKNRIEALLVEIRPQAIPLVDAFEFADFQLDSCLGRYDGKVYESLYDWALNSPLNKTSIHPSIKHLKPHLAELKSKL